jgi:hypothetical protein
MLVIEAVGFRNVLLVPPIFSALVAAQEKHGGATRIKGIQDAIRSALMLDSQFSHVPMTRTRDARRMRKGKRRAVFDEEVHDPTDAHLFVLREVGEPPSEIVRAFDLPSHREIML